MALRRFESEEEKKKRENEEIVGAVIGGAVVIGATALAGYGLYKLLSGGDSALELGNIGVNFNGWRKPKDLSGLDLLTTMKLFEVNELNLKERDWNRATKAVDAVLDLLMKEIRTEARKYDGLVIGEYTRQGSSREGLKVGAPNEFDVLLEFRIEELEFEVDKVSNHKSLVLPELAYLEVDSTLRELERKYPKLYMKKVFVEDCGNVRLSSMNLQEKVFKSIIAAASTRIHDRVTVRDGMEHFEFHIDIRTNPPSINISLTITEKEEPEPIEKLVVGFVKWFLDEAPPSRSTYRTTTIDVDIVPGLLLGHDKVPDPTNKSRTMLCPRYAVFKWFTENHRSASRYDARPDLLWRLCSSGYEKHVIDIAQGMKYQDHIITALRMMKLFFSKEKKRNPYQQVLTVLRSYHLKHIAFYCILFLRVTNKVKLSSSKEAIAYHLRFLEVCLQQRKLPHFFHNNHLLVEMFPGTIVNSKELRYNIFDRTSDDSLRQALLTFPWLKDQLLSVTDDSQVSVNIVNEFQEFVQSGVYF